jgi:hypothetical protein
MSTLNVHATCRCCILMLHVYAICSCCVHFACPCYLSCCMSRLHNHSACPCRMSKLRAHAACPCCMSMLHVHSILHARSASSSMLNVHTCYMSTHAACQQCPAACLNACRAAWTHYMTVLHTHSACCMPMLQVLIWSSWRVWWSSILFQTVLWDFKKRVTC